MGYTLDTWAVFKTAEGLPGIAAIDGKILVYKNTSMRLDNTAIGAAPDSLIKGQRYAGPPAFRRNAVVVMGRADTHLPAVLVMKKAGVKTDVEAVQGIAVSGIYPLRTFAVNAHCPG